MPSPDVLEPPTGLSFGELLDWHLSRGTRPPGSERQGEPWKKAAFAEDAGVSDKQVRNWVANKSLPNDTITIERILFGHDQKNRVTWRMALRDALKRTRSGNLSADPAPPTSKPPAKPLDASNIPITSDDDSRNHEAVGDKAVQNDPPPSAAKPVIESPTLEQIRKYDPKTDAVIRAAEKPEFKLKLEMPVHRSLIRVRFRLALIIAIAAIAALVTLLTIIVR